MTWLLCDYGEVLSLPPTDGDWAKLAATSGWNPARGDFREAYWADRPAYDRADVSVEDYWTRVLGDPPAPDQLGRLIRDDAAGWVHPNRLTVAAAERVGRRGLRLAILSN